MRGLQADIEHQLNALDLVEEKQRSIDIWQPDASEAAHPYYIGYTGLELYQQSDMIQGRIRRLRRKQQRHSFLEPLDPVIFWNS